MLIQENKEVLLPKTAHIIKALYDNDLVEEETLIAWGEKVTKRSKLPLLFQMLNYLFFLKLFKD